MHKYIILWTCKYAGGYSYLEEGMMTIGYQYYDVACGSVCMCVYRGECMF